MRSKVSRTVATLACVTALVHADVHAQESPQEPTAPTPTETAAAADDGSEDTGPLDAEGAMRATWDARIEYHRQLRSTDLSELSSAAAAIGFGSYSLTRDEGFSRGMGGALVGAGGVHLISGIVFTIRSQRALNAAEPTEAFREGDPLARELEDAEHRSDLFLAILLSDASAISGALTTAVVGIARDKPVTQGVGLGLASQGVLTLILDLTHQDQGRRYLRTLRNLQLRVERPQAARGALATFGGVF